MPEWLIYPCLIGLTIVTVLWAIVALTIGRYFDYDGL